MKLNRKVVAVGAAIVALGAGGAGIAYAVSGGSDETVTGASADEAKAAALAAVPGGTVIEIERQDGDGPGAYEVEVKRPDGSQVEVHVNSKFQVVGQASDDDTGSESENESGESESGESGN